MFKTTGVLPYGEFRHYVRTISEFVLGEDNTVDNEKEENFK